MQNYNKSRIHSSRGAKDIDITLDDVTIFIGEIARACGGMVGSSEAFGDVSSFGLLVKCIVPRNVTATRSFLDLGGQTVK